MIVIQTVIFCCLCNFFFYVFHKKSFADILKNDILIEKLKRVSILVRYFFLKVDICLSIVVFRKCDNLKTFLVILDRTQVIFSQIIYFNVFLSCLYPLSIFFTFRMSQNITMTRWGHPGGSIAGPMQVQLVRSMACLYTLCSVLILSRILFLAYFLPSLTFQGLYTRYHFALKVAGWCSLGVTGSNFLLNIFFINP